MFIVAGPNGRITNSLEETRNSSYVLDKLHPSGG